MRIIITAGATREFIDPIRFITNPSTGNMGYALAEAALKREHKVILISGPVNLSPPKGAKVISAVTAQDMFKAVKKNFKRADCLIMSAAVADFRPKAPAPHKIKKAGQGPVTKIELVQNPDILEWAGRNKSGRQLTVGFCMDTKNIIAEAKRKLSQKRADIIAANIVNKHNPAFGSGRTTVYILQKGAAAKKTRPVSKKRAGEILLDKIEGLWYK